MNYFIFFALFTSFFMLSCNKDTKAPPPVFEKDPIYEEYKKQISELEKDYAEIEKSINEARERIQDVNFSPKMADLIKGEIFTQEKFLRLIDQNISFFKIQINERKEYYLTNQETLTEDQIKKDNEAFLLAERSTPKKYIWRTRPGLIVPDTKSKDKPAEDKSSAHGEAKPAEKKSGH